MKPTMKKAIFVLSILGLALTASFAQAQTMGFNEEVQVWGPTFTITVVPSESGLNLELHGHPALNPESRRIDTLDLTVKYDDKDTEKLTREGVGELKEGKIELQGDWKELRFSYKTRRPGTVVQGKTRVTCRLRVNKNQLPASLLFESYKEGPRCEVTDSSS